MYFKVTYSAIYNWKGTGTEKEQNDPSLMDSFCHLIIAHEATTESAWMLLVDQGDDTGVPTTNCVEYIVPRICDKFQLKIDNLRVFEVWPYHKGDPRLKYTEVVISDISFDAEGNRVLRNSWRPTDEQDAKILDQFIKTVGDKVIREEE
ncbi:hypothetical protein [Desulfobacter curvatus]|uniref:hypothetical protein n=1 Tax=Desulfobacter curvatus TaxID=2290 RepID=UPI000377ECCD|nr:hypothetical protein [Desulfobacter curvatus]